MEKPEFKVTDDLMASQGQRFLNFLIDLAVQYIIGISIGMTVVIVAGLTGSEAMTHWIESMSKGEEYLLGITITLFYYGLTEMYFSRTIAKYFTKTLVVMEDGSRPGRDTIIKRTLCRLIPFDALTFLGSNSRGWHDSFSNTYVVQKHKFNEKKSLFDSFEEIGKTEE